MKKTKKRKSINFVCQIVWRRNISSNDFFYVCRLSVIMLGGSYISQAHSYTATFDSVSKLINIEMNEGLAVA